ncbi:MAG: DUF1295 domain-containing protein [Proteobacteria bacterium]|nr:DUF1295 domain-containing protein [Pseudomonadota bacterium]
MAAIEFAPLDSASLLRASAMVLGFLVYVFLASALLPGKRRLGQPLADGTRREYKLNGLWVFLLTTALVVIGDRVFGVRLSAALVDFPALLVVANAVALLWTAQLTLAGRRVKRDRWWRDVWFGPELNPSLGPLDAKLFAYQPSLIGLWLLVVAFGHWQFETLGRLTPQMWLFQAFWWGYLFTHYLREEFMLSTWDILAENFGFMLVWGDLVFVPFFYSIAGWWIATEPAAMATPALVGLVGLHVVGHWIFRESNWQKHRYRKSPEARIWGRPARAVDGRLLVSGWWRYGRKLNYTGEILVYLSISLCAGLASWVPYALPLWLLALLVHRAARDDRRCREKYGDTWERYCALARFRMLPFVY